MLPRYLHECLAALTEEMLESESVEAAFVAAILVRLEQAIQEGTLPALCLRLWQSEA